MRAINNLTDLWQRRASREETAQAVQPNQIPTQQQQEVVHEATSDVLPREEIQPDTPLSELLTSSDHEPEERHNIEQWISLVERLPADNGIRDAMRSVILDSEQYYLFFMESPADALEEGRGAHTQTTEDYNDDAERFLAEWWAMAEEALDVRQWFVLHQTLQAYWNNQVEDVVLVATVRLLFAPDIILDEQSNYFHLHKLWLVFREVIFTEPVSLVKSSRETGPTQFAPKATVPEDPSSQLTLDDEQNHTADMTTSKYQRPHQRLVQLLFLASASTATIISIGGTSLTLSNFQLITQLSVPLGCLLAYNNPIQGCTANDFASGATCSASCRRGLLRMQDNLKDACQAVQVQTNTLLGQALAGNLVGLLCPSNQPQPTSAAPTLKPSSTVIVSPPSSSVVVVPPPPPPPPVTTVPTVIPPPATTPVIIPPSSQSPVIPPSSTAAPPPAQPPPPPPPPPPSPPPAAPTTVVTSTTTNAAMPQSTATASSPVNPLDALLLSNDAGATSRLSTTNLCIVLLSILILAW
ncbi:hypothetical protein CkaCkLH20_04543 [Colletotrichum karsti]|uniref:Filamentous hemagglutinin n=1 Tax=Colletotrichum karsti TaxID=1095194 RepID=A0A9P6LMX8_9PEZI|nr:uncharacterized protein CkaCkLH20_04543 [Colletotrichum karsti]KAF9877967.1 hypothetical protein CkaCkLH20_04543 [Colletotrichum karsti]